MTQFEKTITSEVIYDGRIVKLRIDEVELPDGSFSKREIVSHQGAVAVLAIKAGQMIFVKQYRIASQQLLTEIPAGLLEKVKNRKRLRSGNAGKKSVIVR